MTSAQDWRKVGLAALLGLALCAAAGTGMAQEFPVEGKPITILVPYGAGGVTDVPPG